MSVQYQVMKRSLYTYDILKVSTIHAPPGSQANAYEVLGRVVLDPKRDEYFVERPVWNSHGHEWHRVEKAYLVFQAAFNAIVSPKAPS